MSTLSLKSARRIVEILSDLHDEVNGDNPDYAKEIDTLCGELNALSDTPFGAASISDKQAMDSIHSILDGDEWSSDHLDSVAKVVASTGRNIRSCDDA